MCEKKKQKKTTSDALTDEVTAREVRRMHTIHFCFSSTWFIFDQIVVFLGEMRPTRGAR